MLPSDHGMSIGQHSPSLSLPWLPGLLSSPTFLTTSQAVSGVSPVTPLNLGDPGLSPLAL